MARNPILKTQRAQRIESARVNGATDAIIRPWFRYLTIPAIQAILPEHRFNVDEARIMEG
jgi:hypothetical protein